jgi:hypothetical protein
MRSDHNNEPAQDGKAGAVPPSSARRNFAGGAGWAGWDFPPSIGSSTICPSSSLINHPAIDGIGFPADGEGTDPAQMRITGEIHYHRKGAKVAEKAIEGNFSSITRLIPICPTFATFVPARRE